MRASPDSLVVPRTTENLAKIRRFVADAARRAGFDTRAVGEIEFAVDEVATRAVAHRFSARSLAPHDQLAVTARVVGQDFEVTISDHGEPAKLSESADDLDLNEIAKEYDLGGFDEFVVRKFMDEVEFVHRSSVGNELRLLRALPPRGPRGGS